MQTVRAVSYTHLDVYKRQDKERVNMHITLESDYAIRIVVFLAQQGKRADAKLISENTEVSLRFALKILRKLVSGGIIRSYKGTTGGYELAHGRCV